MDMIISQEVIAVDDDIVAGAITPKGFINLVSNDSDTAHFRSNPSQYDALGARNETKE
jgi:hypothetical protein